MPLQTYLISPYDHSAETRQFKRICDLMEKHCQKEKAEAILIGNYNIEGVELDALLATRHGFLILEFKNWGGHIMARENGQWLADGKTIKGGMGNRIFALVTIAAPHNGTTAYDLYEDPDFDVNSVRIPLIENLAGNIRGKVEAHA